MFTVLSCGGAFIQLLSYFGDICGVFYVGLWVWKFLTEHS